MYRRTKFVEILLDIRQEMALEAEYEVGVFAEMVRTGSSDIKIASRKRLTRDRDVALKADAEPELEITKESVTK